MKTFNKSIYDIPSNSDDHNSTTEKLLSLLYSIEHSHRLLNSTHQMDEREQLCYASKIKRTNEQIKQLRVELDQSELRLIDAKQKRLHLLEYDARADTINKLGTRRELRAQQAATLERKHYFEHLQQTFEAT
jgi:methyl coenzyme M reductase subunit D